MRWKIRIADADQLAKLHARGVRIERTLLAELLGAAQTLDPARLADGRLVSISALFIAPRTTMVSDLPAQIGCAFEDGPSGPYVRVDSSKFTSNKGVYAAGDLSYPIPNATFAAASGVLAGGSAHQSLIFG